ncbi:MAG: YqgE/AlgH family protein [Alphaproteobacteria bacterium]|nr:YqgE/AlgH family protein [Alphaproteobacteria bacterium]
MVYDKMDEFDEQYALTGKFLVAMPHLDEGGCFERSVVYICSHGKRGAMGLIINKRLEKYTFSDLTLKLPAQNLAKLNAVNLYEGGPVEQIRGMVLHSTDYMKDGTIEVSNGIAVSSTTEIIADIALDNGPEDKLVALGYSFWQPQQLEHEIYNNDWLVIDSNKDLLFRTKDEEKWQRALDESGIRLDSFINITGHC